MRTNQEQHDSTTKTITFLPLQLHYTQKKNTKKKPSRFFRVTLLGGFKWPFQGLNDLYLGDQRVTWKKLD